MATKSKFSKQQIIILLTFAISNFFNAICNSLQAPFYPKEAESKGATPTQYGFVFGIFELIVFLCSPLLGHKLHVIGPKFVLVAGLFTTSWSCVLFGILDRVRQNQQFLELSFIVRIVEAFGNAAFLTASFSIIAREFPQNVGGAFAILETFFGLGLVVGPTVGGALYELGGYLIPFAVLGACLMIGAILSLIILPCRDDIKEFSGKSGMLSTLTIPSVAIANSATVTAAIGLGFLQTNLEPHLRPLGLSSLEVGLMFVVNGAAYGLSTPIWGCLSDHHIPPRCVVIIGFVLTTVSFIFVGPAPFLPINNSVGLCVASLLVHGVGFGAMLVASFSGSHREALAHGRPNDLRTHGLISGLWAAAFALGAFIGPSMGGALNDAIGVPWGAIVIAVIHSALGVMTGIFHFIHRCKHYSGCIDEESKQLIDHNHIHSSQDSCYSSHNQSYCQE